MNTKWNRRPTGRADRNAVYSTVQKRISRLTILQLLRTITPAPNPAVAIPPTRSRSLQNLPPLTEDTASNSASSVSAIFSFENSRITLSLPFLPMALTSAGDISNNACRMTSAHFSGTLGLFQPVTPSVIVSSGPPEFCASTGSCDGSCQYGDSAARRENECKYLGNQSFQRDDTEMLSFRSVQQQRGCLEKICLPAGRYGQQEQNIRVFWDGERRYEVLAGDVLEAERLAQTGELMVV